MVYHVSTKSAETTSCKTQKSYWRSRKQCRPPHTYESDRYLSDHRSVQPWYFPSPPRPVLTLSLSLGTTVVSLGVVRKGLWWGSGKEGSETEKRSWDFFPPCLPPTLFRPCLLTSFLTSLAVQLPRDRGCRTLVVRV